MIKYLISKQLLNAVKGVIAVVDWNWKTVCDFDFSTLERNRQIKKRFRIAPLQPPTLAPFPAWGSSKGAGRTEPAAKV